MNFNYGTEVNPLFFTAFPAAEFDSWFTIGSENANGGVNVQNTADTMAPALALFNTGAGFTINDPIGASWFNVFPCTQTETIEECSTNSLAFGGADNRVLLAQITATGDVYGIFNLQVFPGGVQADQQQAIGQTFSTNEDDVCGCTNPDATNYDMEANLDELSCILPCTVALSRKMPPMMAKWLGTMNTPHKSMPVAYGKATKTPSGSRPGRSKSAPPTTLVRQMNGSKNRVSRTAETKACAPSSSYPVAMTDGSPQTTVTRCLVPEARRKAA